MSGIIIDVDTRSAKSEGSLKALNSSLNDIIKNADKTSKSLSGLSGNNLGDLARKTKSTSDSAKAFGTEATNSFKRVSNEAANTAGIISSIKTAVASLTATFAAFTAVNGFNKAADQLTNLNNRLQLVAKSSEEVFLMQRKIAQISQETRGQVGNTASSYVALSDAMKRSNVTQAEQFEILATLNKAASLSGSSVEGLNGAFLQLTQGLSSGTLRGEELNSVLEQFPYLGKAMRETLNKTSGELRAFAEQGQLTDKVMVDVFKNMAGKTAADFSKTSATVEQASMQIRQSASLMFGDLNKHFGFADRFSKNLMRVSGSMQTFGDEFILNTIDVKRSVKNYINQFDLFDAVQLTVRAMVNLDISPLDAYSKYQEYKKIKQYMDSFRNLFTTKLDVKAEAPDIKVGKIDADFSKVDAGARTLKETLFELGGAAFEGFKAVKITFENLISLIPRFQIPVMGLVTSMVATFKGIAASAEAATYDAIMPFTRSVENVYEKLTLFMFDDTQLERYWVNLFQSTSIKEFTENLRKLNEERQSGKLDDMSYNFSKIDRSIKETFIPVRNLLVSLGILDNQLLKLRDSKVDRVAKYFSNIGVVVKRVYKDVFATTVEPIAKKVMYNVQAIYATVADAFHDTFTVSNGEMLGTNLVTGFAQAFGILKRAVKAVFSVDLLEGLFTESMFDKFIGKISGIFHHLGEFFKGFLVGIVSSFRKTFSGGSVFSFIDDLETKIDRSFLALFSHVADSANKILNAINRHKIRYFFTFDFDTSALDKATHYIILMFEKMVKYSWKPLANLEMLIKKFFEKVKDYFFDVYDAVVGHSYWPDMIDGVVEYTDNLFKSESTIKRFTKGVKHAFMDLYQRVIEFGDRTGGVFGDFTDQLANTNWTDTIDKLTSNLASTLLSTLLLLFGDTRLKVSAAIFIASTLNSALGNALTVFIPALAGTLGDAMGHYFQNVVSGALAIVDSTLAALPQAVQSFVGSLGTIGDMFSKLISLVPILHNRLLWGMIAVGALYAKFADGGLKSITEIIFGKEATKKKPGQDGIVDHVKSYFQSIQGLAGHMGPSLFEGMFRNKKLAIVAAASFSSAMLESVNLFEASSIGLPLLFYAIMGKDGGSRVLAEGTATAVKVIKGMFGSLRSHVEQISGSNTILMQLFDLPANAISKMRASSGGASPFKEAASVLFNDFKSAIINLNQNADAYAQRKMTLRQALLTSANASLSGPMKPGTMLDFQKSFNDLITAATTKTANGVQVPNVLGKITESVSDNLKKIRAKVQQMNIVDTLTNLATNIYSSIGNATKVGVSLITDGLSVLFAILKNKYVLITAMTLGLASMSVAASDATTAITGTAGAITKLSLAIAGIVGGLALLGGLKKTFELFKKTKLGYHKTHGSDELKQLLEESEANFAYSQAKLKEAEIRKRGTKLDSSKINEKRTKYTKAYVNLKEHGASDKTLQAAFDANNAAMSAFSARNYAKQRNRISKLQRAEVEGFVKGQVAIRRARIKDLMQENAPAARRAAIEAALQSLSELKTKAVASVTAAGISTVGAVGGIGVALKNVKATLTGNKVSVLQTIAGYHRMREAASKVGIALQNVFSASGFSKITASITLMASAFTNSFSFAIGAVQVLYELGVKKLLGGTASLLKNFSGVAISGLQTLITQIMAALASLRPLLALGGKVLLIAAAVGALGLWLFGPGNTFFDNLEWAYDKVRAIFGLEAKTGGGRSIELAGLVKPTTIEDRETNFSKDLSRVDTAKMTAAQYKAIKSVAEETGKALQDLQLSEAKQGFLTDAQKTERKKIEDDFRNSLARQPQKDGSSSSKDMVDFSRRMLEVDNRVWSVIKRTLGWSAQKGPQEESLYNKTVAYLPNKIASMFEPLTKAVSEATDAISDMTSAAYKAAIEFGKSQAKRVAEFWQFMWDKLKDRPTAFQNFESRESLRIGGMTSQYRQFLPDNVNKVIDDARSEYENAALRVKDLERGHTGVDGKTRNEWIKDNNSAIAALAAKKEFYERISKTYGAFGKEEELLSNFSKDMEKFAAEVKGSLGIDLGPKAIDFKGTEVDKALLLADVKLVEKLNKELERSSSLPKRTILQRTKEDIKARSKQYVDNINAQDTFEGRLAFQTKKFGPGINPDMLRRLSMNNDGFRQTFQELAIAIQSKETDRDQLPADSNLRAKIELELIDLNKQKQNLLPVTSWIDDLNTRLQALNIPQLTSTQYLAADTANIDLLRTALTKAGIAAENVKNILSSGDMLNPESLDQLKKAISEMVRAEANTRRIMDRTVLDEKLSVFNDPSLNDVGKIKRLQDLGVSVDNNTLRRSGNIPQVLTQLKRSLEASSLQLPADGNVDNKTFAQAQQSAINAERALSRLGEIVSLDTLLGQFQELNIALDKSAFASFSANAKRNLMEIGRQLYNLERDVGDKDGTAVGMTMDRIETSRQEKLKRAREIISGESLKSATSIESVLSNAGFSSFELIARMTTDQLKEFVKLANDVAAAQFGVRNAKGPKDYINAQKSLDSANRKFGRFSETNTATFESKTGNINNLFQTNLGSIDFAKIGSKAIDSLNTVAIAFKNDLEEAMVNGVTKGGISLEAMLMKTRKFSEIGEYFTFFSDVSKGMYDAMTKGAKNAFERFKSLYEESPLEFSDFTKLDVATRRGIASKAAGTEAFGKALELPNLSKELTDILNSVGSGVSVDDAMRAFSDEFKRTMGKTFEEATGSPFDRLTGAIERLTNAIEGKTPNPAKGISSKTFNGGIASDTYEAQIQRIRAERMAAFNSAMATATPTRQLQLKDKQIGTASSDKMLRLNKQQRDAANSMLDGILAQQEKINATTVQGLPTDKMYRDLDEMTRLYNAYIERIGSIRQRFVDAGRNFADGVVGSFNSSLSNFLKNKQEENKTRWTTFRDGFLTTITDSVIDTLVSGFTDSFIGENSALRKGIANIGGGIATLFKGGEGSSAVTSTESPTTTGGSGGILDSIVSFFAPVTTVLGMIFGATSSNGVTTVGAISASTTSIVGAINANTFAVTSALSAGTATDGIGLALQVLGTATSVAGATTSSKPTGMGGGSGLNQNSSGVGLKLPRNATGGFIRGPGTGTSDSIPSMLSNGEFVINAAQTSKFRPLLEAINSGNMSFAAGGLVTPSPYVTPTSSNTVTNSSSQQININITGDISRQTKAEIHKLIPVIATGVNAHNREVLMS